MQQAIGDYLKSPHENRRPQGIEDRSFAYLLTYIGELYIQGYRLIQNYGSILLFSLVEFQFSDNQARRMQRKQAKLPARFKILLWEMKVHSILGNENNRREKFNQMALIGNLLDQIQYNIVYLKDFRYSIVQKEMLQTHSPPFCLLYFKKIKWIDYKNGLIPMCNKKEGQQLHKLIEIVIKGAGEGRNPEKIKALQNQSNQQKFNYNLFKIINTICYIIGKEMLQNGFWTMASQKWMRKFSQKHFRRYDLVLRNERRSMIIDWKFSTKTAQQKASFPMNNKKNQLYCQLARKDFKNQVQLRFYCISRASQNEYYHQFTFANFVQQKSTIDLESLMKADYSEIRISDSQSDGVQEQIPEKQVTINNRPTDCIEINSSEEEAQELEDQVQIIQINKNLSSKNKQVSKRVKIVERQNIEMEDRKQNTKKKAKATKIQRKNNKSGCKSILRFPIEVLEIQSD